MSRQRPPRVRTRPFGVVVGIVRAGGEPVRGVRLDEPGHRGRVGEERLGHVGVPAGNSRAGSRGRPDRVAGVLSSGGGYPDPAAGQRGGAAEPADRSTSSTRAPPAAAASAAASPLAPLPATRTSLPLCVADIAGVYGPARCFPARRGRQPAGGPGPPVDQFVDGGPAKPAVQGRGERGEVHLAAADRGVRPAGPPGVADVRERQVLGRPRHPVRRVLQGEPVRHVVRDPQPRQADARTTSASSSAAPR